jgi:hypothetical protein
VDQAADQDDTVEDWDERVTEHVFTLLTPEDYF